MDNAAIAIVGLSCRLPGARDARQYWHNTGQREVIGLAHAVGAVEAGDICYLEAPGTVQWI